MNRINQINQNWKIEVNNIHCPFLHPKFNTNNCGNWDTKTNQCNETDCPIKIDKRTFGEILKEKDKE